ncbi:hypothetical protein E2562_021005 [Oryza meyeriana var. granulata]|uniref:DUF1618 domain-containing protein n=1 Tax=Oryza meyeriana var. granulata TaxID=110450 RepID=A0A6G1DZ73_9ORYZ|nr:hypothetical protein E2562_021005 [Oryza meyeriana var. granulata]
MDEGEPSRDPGKKPMDVGGPSRDPAEKGEDLELAAAAPARCWSPWVILPAIPQVTDNEKKHLMPGTDLSLQFADPPRATMLTVARRIHPDSVTIPCIIDVLPTGRFLLYTTHCGHGNSVYYMCDAHTRIATRLPPSLERPIVPRRSIGFIEDPRHRGHYLVAQLHPTSTTQHKTLVYYSTLTKKWDVKHLASCPHHQLWGCHGGVLAYDGKLWWADSPYGFLTCDPFADEVHLRYVALPEGCVMVGADTIPSRENLDKHRFVKVSEGKLRYVQIHGLPDEPVVTLWTLIDPEGPLWKLEYEVRLEEIWGDDSYMEAGLTQGKVPAIALIDPNNHGVLYLVQGGLLFAVDMRASTNRILRCEKFLLGNGLEAWEKYHTSRFVHAWELPPTLLRFEPSRGDQMPMLSKEMARLSKDLSLMTSLVRMMKDVQVSAARSESSSQPSVDASDQNEEK